MFDETTEEEEEVELDLMAAVKSQLNEAKAVTWESFKEEVLVDKEMIKLKQIAREGFPDKIDGMPKECQDFFPYKDDLSELDEVLLWKGRTVIPKALQKAVLVNLHSAHQGCGKMHARARLSVFWPRISKDIESRRAPCLTCEENAPSHRSLPDRSTYLTRCPISGVNNVWITSSLKEEIT